MHNYKDFKAKLLKNKTIKQAYKELGPEFVLVEKMIDKRLKQGLTQQELAQKVGTKQPVISRLEKGTSNPSLRFLKRIAAALDSKLIVTIS